MPSTTHCAIDEPPGETFIYVALMENFIYLNTCVKLRTTHDFILFYI